MKVYNITDVETPQLKSLGRVNIPIKLGDTIIPPGGSAIVHERYRSEVVQRFDGAAVIDTLPPSYNGAARPKPTVKPKKEEKKALKPKLSVKSSEKKSEEK